MKNPIFAAIDTADYDRALGLLFDVKDHVGGIKLGLEFFCANGQYGVSALAGHDPLPLFLDLKLHDIPNTVAAAVRALSDVTPEVLTVHASGGIDMMKAAKEAAHPRTKVVGVTVLTSLDAADLRQVGVDVEPADQVKRLAELAQRAGLDGIVCSSHEIAIARDLWPEAYLVVPGIRPAGSAAGDQKRIMTPRQAIGIGASALVIGRPITEAPDPAAAAAAIAASLG